MVRNASACLFIKSALLAITPYAGRTPLIPVNSLLKNIVHALHPVFIIGAAVLHEIGIGDHTVLQLLDKADKRLVDGDHFIIVNDINCTDFTQGVCQNTGTFLMQQGSL